MSCSMSDASVSRSARDTSCFVLSTGAKSAKCPWRGEDKGAYDVGALRVPKQGPFEGIFWDRYPPKQGVRCGIFAPTKKEG